MNIEQLVVGQLQTNCYLVWDEKSLESIIIDPGDEGTFIIDKAQQLKLKPQLIIATHGHFDHLLAVLEIKLAFDLPFALHEKDLPHLKKAHRSAEHWLNLTPDPIPEPDTLLKDNQTITFGNQTLQVIPTPGHTPGGICLYSKKHQVIFTGDAIFAHGSIGRTDLSGGNSQQLHQSIQKILSLPPQTTIHPGHGPTSTIESEKPRHIHSQPPVLRNP
jgi:glyoxylase-like metal-dependent hydrolase (beta-lactamase superfamily II)